MFIAVNSVRKQVGVKNAGYIAVVIVKAQWEKQIIATVRELVGDD